MELTSDTKAMLGGRGINHSSQECSAGVQPVPDVFSDPTCLLVHQVLTSGAD